VAIPEMSLDTYLPEFYLKEGTQNFTIESHFLRTNAHSISSLLQLGVDFLRNQTSVVVLRNFNIRYRNETSNEDYTVPWANGILESISFMIQLRREETLGQLLKTGVFDWIKTTVQTIGDFGGAWDENQTTLDELYANITMPATGDTINT
jgi:hypothetical protein